MPAVRFLRKFNGKYFYEGLTPCLGNTGLMLSNKKESISSLLEVCDGRTVKNVLALF